MKVIRTAVSRLEMLHLRSADHVPEQGPFGS
jgi:hypothetical protein